MTEQTLRWHRVDDAKQLQQEASRWVLDAAAAAIAARGVFHVVLAGGGTPKPTYHALRDAQTDWRAWHVYYGDERCVPEHDPQRNSAMARQAWLDHVPLPEANIHAIPAERGAEQGAQAYADTLRDVGAFDLVILGLGEDGHTASLFPGHDWGEDAASPMVLPVHDAPKPPPDRISLSAARLADARQVLFLVDGEGKRDAVRRWLAGDRLPAASICPLGGVDVLVQAGLLDAEPKNH
ncbi:MAG: 6-phosphogluconolactonase [Xanthomonadales bacterium]|nr:6-phosphogluconolactonase [Xanthomonadales bacterium]